MKKILLGLLISVFIITQGICGDVSKSHIFVDGEILTAALLNTGFDEIISELNDIDGDNLSSNIAISTTGACTFAGTNILSGTSTISGTFATTGTSNSIGNGGSDVLTFNTPGGITYTPATTWTFTGAQTVSGTWANLGIVTTVDINGGTIDGVTIGGASLSGKLTTGANEIEGSNFDITGGTITGITDLAVSDGGTGASTLTDGGILLGSGTGAITALGVATNGQIPIGDGTTDPVLATITGTADEVDVTNAAGSITIGIVNPLATSKGGTGATAAANAASGVIIADANAYVATSNLPHGSQLFTSSGTFTAPVGVTKVYLSMCGSGGGGGGGFGSGDASGGGGGGGASVINFPYTVVASNNYTVTINNAGTGGATNNDGISGGTVVFDTLTLAGGISGKKATTGVGGAGGAGGAGGWNGVNDTAGYAQFAGGTGATGATGKVGGGGGSNPFGSGGAGSTNSSVNAASATGYGAGGGGGCGGAGSTSAGGNGSKGAVLVEW